METNKMTMIGLGHHFFCLSLFLYLLLFPGIPFAHSQQVQECDENFSELSAGYLENILSELNNAVNVGKKPTGVLDRFWRSIQNKYPLHKKVAQAKGQECAEVAGIHFDVSYSENEEDYVQEAGTMEAHIHHVVSLNADTLKYDRKVTKGEKKSIWQKESQKIRQIIITIALDHVSPDSLILKVDNVNLCPEEEANITAELKCGGCKYKNKNITFVWKPVESGNVFPENQRTDEDGISRAVFMAKKEGEAVIYAIFYEELPGAYLESNRITLKTEPCEVWDVILTQKHERDYLNIKDFYTMRAEFRDVQAIRKSLPLPAKIMDRKIELFGLAGKGKGFLIEGTFFYFSPNVSEKGAWIKGISEKIEDDAILMAGSIGVDNPDIIKVSVSSNGIDVFFPEDSEASSGAWFDSSRTYIEIPLEKFNKAIESGTPFRIEGTYSPKDEPELKIKYTYEFIPRKQKRP